VYFVYRMYTHTTHYRTVPVHQNELPRRGPPGCNLEGGLKKQQRPLRTKIRNMKSEKIVRVRLSQKEEKKRKEKERDNSIRCCLEPRRRTTLSNFQIPESISIYNLQSVKVQYPLPYPYPTYQLHRHHTIEST
jgi:hypothetical protein